MKSTILITGATGFVGSHVVSSLRSKHYQVIVTSRSYQKGRQLFSKDIQIVQWNYKTGTLDWSKIQQVETVIHLLGEPVAHAFTGKKRQVYDSRIESTKQLVATLPKTVKKFICASAIGYYEPSISQKYTEDWKQTSPKFFLQNLCGDWENEANKASCDVINARLPIVLGKKGFIESYTKASRFKILPQLENGRAWFSWVDVKELADMFVFLTEQNIQGPVNMVSPHITTQKTVDQVFSKAYGAAIMPTPRFLLQAVNSELAGILGDGYHVIPKVLQENKYKFKKEKVEEVLNKYI